VKVTNAHDRPLQADDVPLQFHVNISLTSLLERHRYVLFL
jgi:hypothetical protein